MDSPRQTSAWFERLSRYGWGFIGMAGAAAIIFLALGTVSTLVVPLIMAVFLAVVFQPMVGWLENHGLSAGVAAALVVVGIFGILAGTTAVVVVGIIDQAPEVSARLSEGTGEIQDWLDQSEFASIVERGFDSLGQNGGSAGLGGLASGFGSFVQSAAGVVSGLLLGSILLFYLLRDGDEMVGNYVDNRRPGSRDQVSRILSKAAGSLRAYVKGRSILAVVQGGFIAIILAIMGVPLAFSIGVVNFVGAFIPYLGAFLGGAFAVVIALSEGGIGLAAGSLAVILFTNVVLENVLEPRLVGSSLDLHPIWVLMATVVGGTLFGILGVILASPLTSIGIYLFGELRRSGFFGQEEANLAQARAASSIDE